MRLVKLRLRMIFGYSTLFGRRGTVIRYKKNFRIIDKFIQATKVVDTFKYKIKNQVQGTIRKNKFSKEYFFKFGADKKRTLSDMIRRSSSRVALATGLFLFAPDHFSKLGFQLGQPNGT